MRKHGRRTLYRKRKVERFVQKMRLVARMKRAACNIVIIVNSGTVIRGDGGLIIR